jgi:hypothetical protein
MTRRVRPPRQVLQVFGDTDRITVRAEKAALSDR